MSRVSYDRGWLPRLSLRGVESRWLICLCCRYRDDVVVATAAGGWPFLLFALGGTQIGGLQLVLLLLRLLSYGVEPR